MIFALILQYEELHIITALSSNHFEGVVFLFLTKKMKECWKRPLFLCQK